MTFSIPHVFKALQLLNEEKFVSRSKFCNELHLGEGAIKTLILHLKDSKMIETTKSGTFLTTKGKKFSESLIQVIRGECPLGNSKIFPEKNNHAIILKNFSKAIKTGLEQRDYAILYGASGCITLLYKNNQFVFPGDEKAVFGEDDKVRKKIMKNLTPNEGDVIIISSATEPFVAEVSAKNSALWTLATS
ncbi:MAG: DUF4443 domain-containing protein [Nitrosopumilaceae archaeon]|nr:DUF4443 domain-containing protein [Nitrosopumilaceae archaeon]